MPIDPLVADLTLAEVRAAQRRNRVRSGSLRFPMLAVGVLNLLAAPWALVMGRDHLGIFFVVGLPIVAWRTGIHHRRRADIEGVKARVAPWVLSAFGLLALSAVTSHLGFTSHTYLLTEIGPTLVFAFGYLLLGWWGHNRPLVLATLGMIAFSVATPVIAAGDAGLALQLVVDAALLIVAARQPVPFAGPAG